MNHFLRQTTLGVLLGAVLASFVACSEKKPTTQQHTLKLGEHQMELVVSANWSFKSVEGRVEFRKEKSSITFEDFGPCTTNGFRRALLEARDLCREKKFDESSERLDKLKLEQLVPNERERNGFISAWTRINHPNRSDYGARPEEIEPAYEKFLQQIEGIPAVSIEDLSADVVETYSQGGLQETSQTERINVADQPAMVIDTWDKLTHTMRRRYLFVIHNDHLLMVKSNYGDFADLQSFFDELVASTKFTAEESEVVQ